MQPANLEAVTAAYASVLGAIAADATVIERAQAATEALQNGGGDGGDQNRNQNQHQHRHTMSDGTGFDVDDEGNYSISRPDGSEVIGAPDGPRQIRHRNRMMNAGWEDQGPGERRRLRVHLQEGCDLLVTPPAGPTGEMYCEGPGGWQFRVRENEDGSIVVSFGHHFFTVTRGEGGALAVTMPDNTRWIAEVQDDGSILVSNPAGQPMWTIVINEDGSLTVTHMQSGQTSVVLPSHLSDDGTESGGES